MIYHDEPIDTGKEKCVSEAASLWGEKEINLTVSAFLKAFNH